MTSTADPESCALCGTALLDRPAGSPKICDVCLQAAWGSFLERPDAAVPTLREAPTPRDIKRGLDAYVVGQEAAKRALSVAVHNHYKRIEHNWQVGSAGAQRVELAKSNILLVGPTGSGKTLMAETLARFLQVPFAIYDATSLTEAGYVGEDVENVLLRLIQSAAWNVPDAERGIIYLDEIDKIGRKAASASVTRDVSGEGVQQALLKIIEGTVANVPRQGGRKHPNQDYLQINTRNILFIMGGTFAGIEQIQERRGRGRTLGFGSAEVLPEDDLWARDRVAPSDLLEFGLIPEFIGRIPVLVKLDALDEFAMTQILTEPRNAVLRQYEALLAMDHARLVVTDEARRRLARVAIARGSGARGLRAMVERLLEPVMFDLPGSGREVTVTLAADQAASGGVSVAVTDTPVAKRSEAAA